MEFQILVIIVTFIFQMSYNNNVDRTYVTHGMGVMTMMNKKILTTTIALVAALGLAGCSTSATSTSQVSGHEPQAAKVAKATSHKASKKSTNSSNKNEKNSEATNSTATFESAKASSQGSSTASLKAASAATTATSATKSSQATATTKNDEQVLNQFMAQSGVKAEEGNQYMVTNQGNGQYQIEVRNSDGDQNISHLSGLYHYNTNTNHVSQMNVTTGQFN